MTKTQSFGLALSLALVPLSGCLEQPAVGEAGLELVLGTFGGGSTCFGKQESQDGFGRAFAAGDFDGDGDRDLAIAAPTDQDYGVGAIGGVYVYRRVGAAYVPWARVSATTLGLGTTSATKLGERLVAADFDRDGKAELGITISGPDANGIYPGHVAIAGADDAGDFVLQQRVTQAGLGTDQPGDRFGDAMAVGDFDGDGASDLVVGAWHDDDDANASSTLPYAGRVYVFRGGGAQLAPWRVLSPQAFNQSDGGRFGSALAVGDFDANGLDDLAVGAWTSGAHGTVLTYRSLVGNPLAPSRLIDGRNYIRPSGTRTADFGISLAAGDVDGDGDDELAVGAPVASAVGNDTEEGAVVIFRNATSTPSVWRTIQMPFPGANQGRSLVAGDFDGNGADDLAVGQDRHVEIGTLMIWKGRVASTMVLGDTYDESLDEVAVADLDGDGRTDLLASPAGSGTPASYGMGRTGGMPVLDGTIHQQAPGCTPYWGAPPAIALVTARQRSLSLRLTATGTVDHVRWWRDSGPFNWRDDAAIAMRTDEGLTPDTQYCYYGKTLVAGSDAYSDYSPRTCFRTALPIAAPTITLTGRTVSSLSVRMVASNGAARIRSRLEAVTSTTRTDTGTTVNRTFSGLTGGTSYCVIADSYHPATDDWSAERRSCFTTMSPTETGSTPVWVYLQAPGPSGLRAYAGSWGPITGARPVRLRVPAVLGSYWLHFLKPGHSSDDCDDPDAVVSVADGGTLDAAAIATIQGTTPPPGSQLFWLVCRTSDTVGDPPGSVTFTLDWERP